MVYLYRPAAVRNSCGALSKETMIYNVVNCTPISSGFSFALKQIQNNLCAQALIFAF